MASLRYIDTNEYVVLIVLCCTRHLSRSTQIDTFAQQLPALEMHMKSLNQGLNKYVEKHREVYERDMQRISELFARMHVAVQADVNTPGKIDSIGRMRIVSIIVTSMID
jgi:hypothetical protein